jgi:nicotinate-nucleotide pyrophosphorylase (carboxylating)
MDINQLVERAINEDIPYGDKTVEALGIKDSTGDVKLVAKEDLIVSGSELFEQTVLHLDPSARLQWHFSNAQFVLAGQTVCSITGSLPKLIQAERVALNFLGHLSGIATYTKCFVNALGESKTRILDTRKTTPLYRALEKQAVKHGGGLNHRMNLSDAIMIKENHIRMSNGLKNAVSKIREATNDPICLEVTSLEELSDAIELKVERVLLDNMSNEQLKKALEMLPDRIESEASGNMSVQRVAEIKDLGLNFISVGAITHSAPTADFSLLFDIN